MESELVKQIKALTAMNEDDFSRDIIKPLFESMGYSRVDFNGGPNERGRDIIAEMTIPPFEDPAITYIQSKKIGSIQNAKESQKFTALLHQLRACATQPLTLPDGRLLEAQHIFLACPEQATNKFIEEVGNQLHRITPKVNILDGPKIIEAIKKYKPELLKLLISVEDILTSGNTKELQNVDLLRALDSAPSTPLTSYYSDLSFFVGSIDSNVLFSLEVSLKKGVIQIRDTKHWERLKTESNLIEKKFGLKILTSPVETIEEVFNYRNEKYNSTENKENIGNAEKLREKITVESESIKFSIEFLANYIEDKGLSSDDKETKAEVKEILEELLSKIKDKSSTFRLNVNIETLPKHLAKEIKNIQDAIKTRHFLSESLKNIESRIFPEAFIEVELNQDITSQISLIKERYRNGISDLQSRRINSCGIKQFLTETEDSLAFIERIVNSQSALSGWCTHTIQGVVRDRVSLSPHDIFSTGKNIAVYGGAGVGKTTTLQAYANLILKKDNNLSFYIPLNKLSEKFNEKIPGDGSRDFLEKDLIIKSILMIKGIPPTNENITSVTLFLSDKTTVILDGLDEIYNSVPEIIGAISQFNKKFPSSQLIISSRDCVSYLSDIDFLGITLLPFTKDQLTKFIIGWMNDDFLSEELLNEIEKNDLYDYLKTPLLATITCALTKNGVQTPTSEYAVYDERLLLLTGEYDKQKKVERQKFKGSVLLKAARKIAYSLQKENLRAAALNKLSDILANSFSGAYSPDSQARLLRELIDPCNILRKDPITEEYSFGHFRFQEHLAAEELKQNRSIDLTDLALLDWWRGVLTLYAQENEFSHLLEDLYQRHHNIQGALTTIESMVNAAPKQNRPHLKELVKRYKEADFYDDILAIADDERY